jgi:hypothetical protein
MNGRKMPVKASTKQQEGVNIPANRVEKETWGQERGKREEDEKEEKRVQGNLQ